MFKSRATLMKFNVLFAISKLVKTIGAGLATIGFVGAGVDIVAIGLVITLILTLMCYISPSFCLVFMILTTSFMLVICFPFRITDSFTQKRLFLINLLLELLNYYNILDLFATLYINIFSLEPRKFKLYVSCFFIPIFFYPIISRYYITIVVQHQSISFLTYLFISITLFTGLFFIYLRLILSFSVLVTNLAYVNKPTLLNPSILYVLDPNDQETPPVVSNNKSLFHFDKSKHTNYNTYVFPNSTFLKRLGVCTAVAGTCIAFYAALQTGQQTTLMQRQVEQETRMNDLEELSQGLMTKEAYNKKWPQVIDVEGNSNDLSFEDYKKLSNSQKAIIAQQSREARNKE
jgi:hypothetical protein